MASAIDFELVLTGMSDEELEASLGGRRPAEERAAALRILVGRSIKRAAPILRKIAKSAASIASMRATASIALGKDADPANQPPLIAALKADDERVVRRAAEALGRIGDRKALAALRNAVVPSAPAAARAHHFARSLISYRLGLGSDLLVSRTAVQPLGRGARSIEAEPLKPARRRQIEAYLDEEAPGIALTPKGGLLFDCEGSSYVVLPAAQAADLVRMNAVAAVVLRRSGPLDRFALHLYLLTHPEGVDRIALHGVRPDGTVTHRGEITITSKGQQFRLEALDTPLAPAIQVEGSRAPDDRTITIKKLKVGGRADTPQARARVPQRGASAGYRVEP